MGASAPHPSSGSTPPAAPTPESVEFTAAASEARLQELYGIAFREMTNPDNPPRERAQWGGHVIRLSAQMHGVTSEKQADARDTELLKAAETLEELQTRGPIAGGDDSDPPFDAPETPAPN